MSDRIDVKLMGIVVGTASGWDQSGDYALGFYAFEPAENIHPSIGLQSSSFMVFDPFQEGNLTSYDADGEWEWQVRFSAFFEACG